MQRKRPPQGGGGGVLNCAEINSSFNRSHRTEVYARWADQTPPGFCCSVKLPRAISHDGRLRAAFDAGALMVVRDGGCNPRRDPVFQGMETAPQPAAASPPSGST